MEPAVLEPTIVEFICKSLTELSSLITNFVFVQLSTECMKQNNSLGPAVATTAAAATHHWGNWPSSCFLTTLMSILILLDDSHTTLRWICDNQPLSAWLSMESINTSCISELELHILSVLGKTFRFYPQKEDKFYPTLVIFCFQWVYFTLHHAPLVPPTRHPCEWEPHVCLGQKSQKASYLSGACCPGAGGCHAPVTKATGFTACPEKTGWY